jgi:chromosome segregation ATPase
MVPRGTIFRTNYNVDMNRLTVTSILPLCIFAQGAFAQAPDSAGLQAVVTEIHQLRLAVERAGAATPRIQITLQRLLSQEQKVARISGQLTEVRKQIAGSEHNPFLAMLESMSTKIDQEQDASHKKAMEEQLRGLKIALEQQTRMVQQWRSEETELAGSLRLEQAKADELNDYLAALERSLDVPVVK